MARPDRRRTSRRSPGGSPPTCRAARRRRGAAGAPPAAPGRRRRPRRSSPPSTRRSRPRAAAQPAFVALPLAVRATDHRGDPRRRCSRTPRRSPGRRYEETGLGRVEDKVVKNRLVTEKTPGLEDLCPQSRSPATTASRSSSRRRSGSSAPSRPCTNPTSTIICNAIGMLAAGNAVVFNVHPPRQALLDADRGAAQQGDHGRRRARRTSSPASPSPTIETAQAAHAATRPSACSSSPAAARWSRPRWRAASAPSAPARATRRSSSTRPPTSTRPARDIVLGASIDNNIICIDEKEVFCVAMVADGLIKAMTAQRRRADRTPPPAGAREGHLHADARPAAARARSTAT